MVCDILWGAAVTSLLCAASEVARLKALAMPPSACIFSSSFLVSGSILSISCTGGTDGGRRWYQHNNNSYVVCTDEEQNHHLRQDKHHYDTKAQQQHHGTL